MQRLVVLVEMASPVFTQTAYNRMDLRGRGARDASTFENLLATVDTLRRNNAEKDLRRAVRATMICFPAIGAKSRNRTLTGVGALQRVPAAMTADRKPF